jgi:hypothetical protein
MHCTMLYFVIDTFLLLLIVHILRLSLFLLHLPTLHLERENTRSSLSSTTKWMCDSSTNEQSNPIHQHHPHNGERKRTLDQ